MSTADEEKRIHHSTDAHEPAHQELQEHKDRIYDFIADASKRGTPEEQAKPLGDMIRFITSSPHKQELYPILFDYAVDHAAEHTYAYMDVISTGKTVSTALFITLLSSQYLKSNAEIRIRFLSIFSENLMTKR